MPTIAIDARKYFDFGIGSYIQNLVSSLAKLRSEHDFVLYLSPGDFQTIPEPSGWIRKVGKYGKYSAGELLRFGREIRRERIDLFHEPHYTLPFGLQGKSAVTVHDLIHLKFPQYFSISQRAYAALVLRQAVRQAGAVIAVSHRTKEDLMERFGVPEDAVIVVHNGVKQAFKPLVDRSLVDAFRSGRSIQAPYVLYVGNVKPHKNIPTLLKAFAGLRRTFGDTRLVFAGGSCLGDQSLRLLVETLGLGNAISDLGQLTDSELLLAYNGAEMVVLPSYYEGFGFPALEAMACGTPVIASTGGALPEVVGDAGILCDPGESGAFAEAMISLLTDSQKRSILVQSGLQRAGRFSWEDSAANTLAVYNTVLERCRNN